MYDYASQEEDELSLTAGEVLTVTKTNFGDDWWEGFNSKGKYGLFPEAFVAVSTRMLSVTSMMHFVHHFFKHFL